jgi:diguanylate cyclase (GGDEF)-like protein/PAS domain S-box-containing protein
LARVAFCLALIFACLLPPGPAQARAEEAGRLVLVHPGDAPPYCFRDDDGQPAGLLVDFWRIFASRTGMQVELRLAPDALDQVEQGRADAHAGFVPGANEEDRFLFSGPIADLGIGLFAARLPDGAQPQLDDQRMVAGLLEDDPSSAFLSASFPKLKQRAYSDLPSLAAALALGQVSVAAGPRLMLGRQLRLLGGNRRFELIRSFPGPQLRAALRRGDSALLARINSGLERVSPDEMAGLEERWSGPRRYMPPAWLWGLGAAAAALALALVFFFRARRLRAAAAAQMHETVLLRENLMAEMARHKKTQDLFAAAIEQSPAGTIIAFPGGEMPPVLNHQAMNLLGLDEVPPLGRSTADRPWTLFTPAGRLVPREELPIELVLQNGETLHNAEYRAVLADGGERWILLNAAPVVGQDGERRAAVIVFNDITASRQAERDLARFKFLLDAGVEEVYLARPDGTIDYVNEAAAKSLGYARGELLNRHISEIDPQFDLERHASLMRDVREGPRIFETVHRTSTGELPVKEIKAFYMRFGDEEFVCGFGQDITERRRMQEELMRTRALFAAALDQTLTGIVIGDAATGEVGIINPAAKSMLGLSDGQTLTAGVIPAGWRALRPDGTPYGEADYPLRRALLHGETTENLEVLLQFADRPARWLLINASPIRDASGATTAAIMALSDISARKQMETQLLFKAQHDALTGLPNRTLCLERIQTTLERTIRGNGLFAVAFMDLDRFKMLNDSLGHSFGDRVLAEAARRLVLVIGGMGTVGRFGGDEFVLVVEEASSAEDAQALIRQAMETLRQPMRVEGQEVRLTASVGVVVGPTTDSPTAESILQNADLAMHRAKDSGRDRIRLFHPGMLRRALELLALDADMRRGLEQDEFVVYYQPVMHADGSGMSGMEALVRWKSPARGLVTPHAFIPHAEESGLIVPLGEMVLNRACATMAAWRARFPAARSLSLAVNLSARQFAQPDIVENVREVIVRTGLPPAMLKLELTESTLMADPEGALSAMRRLRALGVSLAIDDFGTGYSSLAYLQRFPVDILKIDRSFVRDLPRGDDDSLALVRAITALADSLRMRVVAEGVESREQLDILAKLGCGAVQGFLFHPPLPEDEMAALLGPEELDKA